MGIANIPSLEQITRAIKADPNVRNLSKHAKHYGPQLPRNAVHYVLSKVPIIQWIPHYSPSWLIDDIVAGEIVTQKLSHGVCVLMRTLRSHNRYSPGTSELILCHSRRNSRPLRAGLQLAAHSVLRHNGDVKRYLNFGSLNISVDP